jgi:PAS domain S-box-containing protein
MNLLRLPLRRLMPLSLAGFLLPVIIGLFAWHQYTEQGELRQAYLESAERTMHGFRRFVQEGLRVNDLGMVQRFISSEALFLRFSKVLGIGANGKVLLAADASDLGRPVAELALPPSAITDEDDEFSLQLLDGGTRIAIHGVVPETQPLGGVKSIDLRWLYLELDIHQPLARNFSVNLRYTLQAVALLLLFILLLWIWLHRAVTLPLERLRQGLTSWMRNGLCDELSEEGSADLIETARLFNHLRRELRERDAALNRQRLLYKALSDTNQAIVRAVDESELLNSVCHAAVAAGFQQAWIGRVDTFNHTLHLVAAAGSDSTWLREMQQRPGFNDDPLVRLMVSGEEQIIELQSKRAFLNSICCSEALMRGIRAGAIFPIHRSGQLFGSMAVLGMDESYFDGAATELLREIAENLSYALDMFDKANARKRADRYLNHDRALLRTLIDSIPDLIVIKDSAHVFLGCNKAFESLAAKSESLLLGGTDFDIFPADQARFFQQQDEIMLRLGKPRRNEEWVEYPDGRRALFDTLKTPYRGADGKVLGLIGISRDITAEFREREQRMQTLELLRNAEQIAGLGSWTLDPQSGKMQWSDVIYRILGATPEEVNPCLAEIRERTAAEQRQAIDDIVEQLRSGRIKEFQLEHRIITRHGESRYVINRGCVLEEDSRMPLKIVGTLQDISDRVQMESDLRAKSHALGERVKELRCLLGTVSALSHESWSMEHALREVIALLPAAWQYPEIAAARIRIAGLTLTAGAFHETPWMLSAPICNAQGAAGTLELCYLQAPEEAGDNVFLPEESELLAAIAMEVERFMVRLHTEEQRNAALAELTISEHRFRAATDSAKDLIYERNPASGEMQWFGDVDTAFGYPAGGFARTTEAWLASIHDEDRPQVLAALNRLAGESDSMDISYRVSKPDGSWMHWIDRGRLLDTAAVQEPRFIGSCTDVTELMTSMEDRLRLQQELRQAQKMEAIGQLTAGIAHDFNNILASILGFSDMASRRFNDLPEEKLRDYFQRIHAAAGRGRDLVRQLVTFSRGESTAEPVSMDPLPLLQETIKMLRSTMPAGIRIESEFPSGLPNIVIDPVHLSQALMNLCINARDALGDKGLIRITLALREELQAVCAACGSSLLGDWVELSVIDDGPGIALEEREKLFDVFYSNKPDAKSSGMGLSVIHSIMCHYAGHILLDSEIGKGSAFRLLFPPVAEPEPASAPQASHALLPDGAAAPIANHRVMVVDDEVGIVLFLEDFLTMQGLQVNAFTNSPQALQAFQQAPDRFDLLITDQSMPDLSGLELVEQVKALRADLPVILCSGYSERISAHNAGQYHIDHYLDKPVNADELLSAVFASLRVV